MLVSINNRPSSGWLDWLINKLGNKSIQLVIHDKSFVFSSDHEYVIPNIWDNGSFLITDEHEILDLIRPVIAKIVGKGPFRPLITVKYSDRTLTHPEKIPISYYLSESGARNVIFEE